MNKIYVLTSDCNCCFTVPDLTAQSQKKTINFSDQVPQPDWQRHLRRRLRVLHLRHGDRAVPEGDDGGLRSALPAGGGVG